MQLRSIAYVDDEPDLREVVQLALSLTTGATVQCYASGAQALLQLPALRPDLVLLDVMMPEMDGTEVIQQMQKDRLLETIPVIFMTAKALPDEVARLRSLGAVGVISKPFNPTRLGEEVLAQWQAATTTRQAGAQMQITNLASSLAARFAHRTLAELPGVRESSARLGQGNADSLQQLKRWAHKIRGTAATLGLVDVSARAGEIEDFLSRGSGALAEPAAGNRFGALLVSLEANLAGAAGHRE
jgi:two-component system, OmpR family, response regulator